MRLPIEEFSQGVFNSTICSSTQASNSGIHTPISSISNRICNINPPFRFKLSLHARTMKVLSLIE